MLRSRLLVLTSMGCTVCFLSSAYSLEVPPNSGISSVVHLCDVLDHPLKEADVARLSLRYPRQGEISLAQIKEAANELGVTLLAVQITLEELATLDRPCLVPVQSPEEFVVVLDMWDSQVRVWDRSGLSVQDCKEFGRRFLGYALLTPEAEGKGARIRFDQPDFHFGVRGMDQVIEHIFTFRNVGMADLTLAVEGTSCRCTAVLLDRSVFPPGQGGGIKVSLHTEGFGNLVETVTVKTNDPRRPKVFLTMRGTVPLGIRVYPAKVFVSAAKGQGAHALIILGGPLDLDVSNVVSDQPFLLASVEPGPRNETAKSWRISIELSKDAPAGKREGHVTITTRHPEQPEIIVPVIINVRPDIELSPAQVFAGIMKAGQKAESFIFISSRSGQHFRIKQVDVSVEGVRVGEAIDVDGSHWKIPVTIEASSMGRIEGKILITTDLPGEEQQIVPILAHVQ